MFVIRNNKLGLWILLSIHMWEDPLSPLRHFFRMERRTGQVASAGHFSSVLPWVGKTSACFTILSVLKTPCQEKC